MSDQPRAEVEVAEVEVAEFEVTADTEAAQVEDDLLVEEVSIDGMCGVY
jgi:mycofactocin precursor